MRLLGRLSHPHKKARAETESQSRKAQVEPEIEAMIRTLIGESYQQLELFEHTGKAKASLASLLIAQKKLGGDRRVIDFAESKGITPSAVIAKGGRVLFEGSLGYVDAGVLAGNL